jgi:hypothetical protein
MTIHINDNRTLQQIQEEFNTRFPLLKIEFFAYPHGQGGGSAKAEMLAANTVLKSLPSAHVDGELIVTGDMTVAQLEKAFREHFGLNAQVFRLSGRAWLETTVTDSWTLTEQSRQAAILQHPAE